MFNLVAAAFTLIWQMFAGLLLSDFFWLPPELNLDTHNCSHLIYLFYKRDLAKVAAK